MADNKGATGGQVNQSQVKADAENFSQTANQGQRGDVNNTQENQLIDNSNTPQHQGTVNPGENTNQGKADNGDKLNQTPLANTGTAPFPLGAAQQPAAEQLGDVLGAQLRAEQLAPTFDKGQGYDPNPLSSLYPAKGQQPISTEQAAEMQHQQLVAIYGPDYVKAKKGAVETTFSRTAWDLLGPYAPDGTKDGWREVVKVPAEVKNLQQQQQQQKSNL